MWKDWIVEVFVPIQSDEGNKGKIVTGYPVARNRILTVRHAVFPKDADRDESRPIVIRWHYPNAVKQWQQIREVAWESEAWDLALLD